jgi:hypothetical protein
MMSTRNSKFAVGDRVKDKETHKLGRVTFVYSTLELRDEFICSTAVTKRSLFRPTAFAKSQRSSHECRSCDLKIAAAVCLATPATAAITSSEAKPRVS